MKVAIKKILWTLLALALKGGIKLCKIFIYQPYKIAGKIFFKATLPAYNSFLILKRIFLKFYSPLQKKHSLIHPFARRYQIHILIITISFLVVTSNLNANEINLQDLPFDNILSKLAPDDEEAAEVTEYEDTIYEEGPVNAQMSEQYLETSGVGYDAFIDYDYDDEFELDTLAGGGALVKPLTPAEGSALQRGEIIEYTVEEGDVISTIARRFGITTNTILWENNLTAYSIIRPGQKLTILPVSGVRHKVASGDTLAKISKKYSVSDEDIIDYNKLASANDLKTGERLIVPGGKKAVEAPAFALRKITPISPTAPVISSVSIPGAENFLWPSICKRITQYFTWRHRGVDIACQKNSNIIASANGTVIRSQGGWNGGYGIMVVIDHGNGIQTLYGHLNKTYVEVGNEVVAGQPIGAEGSTGRSTGPHVHYEIRKDGQRVNPLSSIK